MSRQMQLAKFRGDPGLLGSVAKLVTKAAPKLVKAIPGVGLVATAGELAYSAYSAVKGSKSTPTPAGAPPAVAAQLQSMQRGGITEQEVRTMSWEQIAQRHGITTQAAKDIWYGGGDAGVQQAGIVSGGKALVRAGGKALATPLGQKIAKGVGAAGTAIGLYEGGKAIMGMFGGGGGAMVPVGYHYNKVLRRYEVAEAQGRDVQDPRDRPRVVNEIVRNRSMNPLNPRALTRAFSRVKGAQRWARRLVTFQKKAKVVRRGKK